MEKEINRRVKILLEKLQKKTILLYGAGKRGKVALDNLNALGLGQNVIGFLDDDTERKEEEYFKKRIYLSEDVKKFESLNVVIIITTYSVNKMICKLMENNVSSENIYYFPELLIDDVEVDIFKRNRTQIEEVYNSLNDYLSKYIYKSLFEIYMNGNIGILSRTKGDTQYFPLEGTRDAVEGFYFTDNESFVDCGAFDGDTIRDFKINTNNRYKKIWAFEPDTNNFLKLSEYIKKEQDMRVQMFQAGVFDKDTVMFFSGNLGTSSTLDVKGEDSIKVYQIDSLIKESVTFIKMDIEGSEKKALLGAEKTIIKYKPKLAICIYHNIEDLWEIPLLIKRLNPEYQIYIRNYEDRIDETICYAI